MAQSVYYSPTLLYIEEPVANIGILIKNRGYKRILFVYGKASIKQNGLYDTIVSSLTENAIDFIDCGGVSANPKLSFVEYVLAQNYQFDFILAVGGGSVIDTAKSISVSYLSHTNPWDFNAHLAKPINAVPLGVILTIAAAGSEMSNSCVLTNEALKCKQGFNSDLMRPQFAIMNPELTFSVSKYQTACGIVDILMHTLERYINDKTSHLAEEFSLAVIKTVIDYGIIAYNEPNNYEARKALMLASSFSHNGLTSIGRLYYFRAHQFEHVISGVFDEVAHGAGLAVVWLAYSKYIYQNPVALPLFLRLSYEIFGVLPTDDKEKDAYSGIMKLEEYFQQIGMPTKMLDLGISPQYLEEFALRLSQNKTRIIPDIIPIDYEIGKQIFAMMW